MREIRTETLVLGGGPGGYTAAFRAADLGQKVVLVEERDTLGGVCLNEGCIPSKALLHVANMINEAAEGANFGLDFGPPKIDLDKVRAHKRNVVGSLTKGLDGLALRRKVERLRGRGVFADAHTLRVLSPEGEESQVRFDRAIIAVGSLPVRLPFIPEDPRIMESTEALALDDVPGRLLIMGGGIIGLEMATVYGALGSEVTVVELTDQLIPPADPDLAKPLGRVYGKRLHSVLLETKVTSLEPLAEGIRVSFEGKKAPEPRIYDKVLVSIGRRPATEGLGLESIGVERDGRGFIQVNGKRQTSAVHIYAIGDVTPGPMLAHKAVREGKVAAEVISGKPSLFDPLCIPGVAYTDPELAWTGLTEKEAAAEGREVGTAVFPWAASGRSLSLGRSEGKTKVVYDGETKRILGVGIVGPHAGELIGEAVAAMEMGADLEDLGMIIHAHPTLSETLGMAAELAEGVITDL